MPTALSLPRVQFTKRRGLSTTDSTPVFCIYIFCEWGVWCVCVFICVCPFVFVYSCVLCICRYTCQLEVKIMCNYQPFATLLFESKISHWDRGSPVGLYWLSMSPRDLLVYFLITTITGMYHCAWHFFRHWETRANPHACTRKHFDHQAIFPA